MVTASAPEKTAGRSWRKAVKLIVRRARWPGKAMAAAAPYRATAISPTRGSHRSVMLCLTTRSRAPPQDPKCGGDRQTDEMRLFGRSKAKALSPVLSKPTHNDGAGQVALVINLRLDPRNV